MGWRGLIQPNLPYREQRIGFNLDPARFLPASTFHSSTSPSKASPPKRGCRGNSGPFRSLP